jgi:hypothetical protein
MKDKITKIRKICREKKAFDLIISKLPIDRIKDFTFEFDWYDDEPNDITFRYEEYFFEFDNSCFFTIMVRENLSGNISIDKVQLQGKLDFDSFDNLSELEIILEELIINLDIVKEKVKDSPFICGHKFREFYEKLSKSAKEEESKDLKYTDGLYNTINKNGKESQT